MADNIVNLPTNDAGAMAEVKRMHHIAGDQLVEQAVNMLAFMELAGEVETAFEAEAFTLLGKTVADMAEAIVGKLVLAQKHYRESL